MKNKNRSQKTIFHNNLPKIFMMRNDRQLILNSICQSGFIARLGTLTSDKKQRRIRFPSLSCTGLSDALPTDVASLLRKAYSAAPPPRQIDLDLEAMDSRAACDIIVQILAFRPSDVLNMPSDLQRLHFTTQLYDFPAITTEPALLTAAPGQPDTLILVSQAACLPICSPFQAWLT